MNCVLRSRFYSYPPGTQRRRGAGHTDLMRAAFDIRRRIDRRHLTPALVEYLKSIRNWLGIEGNELSLTTRQAYRGFLDERFAKLLVNDEAENILKKVVIYLFIYLFIPARGTKTSIS